MIKNRKIVNFLILIIMFLILLNPLELKAQTKENDYFLCKGKTNCKTVVYDSPSFCNEPVGLLNKGTVLKIYQSVVNWDEYASYRIIRYKNGWGYVPYYDVDIINMFTETRTDASNIKTYDFISLEGKILDGSYNQLLNTYLLIPAYIRNMFQTEGFILRMTENDVQYEAYGKDGYKDGGLHAVFDYELKKLWTNDENPRYIVHEMGHYVNDRLGMFSSRAENKEIYKLESKKTSLYSVQGPNEYYAECFDMYFRCPALLRELSPISYKMIERSLNEFYNLASTVLPEELL